ncbi:caspase-1-A-like isoform X2 [Mizuhopecten yessoensis]|uniref:caspase-1-A-like isoform X2 n=1 Tax=Mizuhopecten yessoensis TaxID=6573 RepID=UPI000B457BDD|nr:caspase-1-A-like isoform X2 [Mizuhopecten yessoensis]
MADTGIVTGAQLADQSVNIKKLLSRLSRSLPLEYVRCQQSSSTTYDFTHPRRGLAIIISNGKFLSQEPRPYADAEIFNMQKLFKKLCFDVLSFQDLTKKQMLSVLQDAAKLKEFHHQSDCFACVIGSHGAEISSGLNNHSALNTKKHVIYGTDDHVDTNRLTDLFSDSNCPGLRHKPKLFFIQACRKDSTAPPESGLDIGIDINITSGQPPTSTHPHIFALYEPRGTPTLSRHDRLGSVNKVETVEFGREFDSSEKDTEAAFKDNTNIIKNETPSSQAEMSPISPTENSTSLSSPEGNEMNPISPKENSTSLSSPEGNGMSPTLQDSTAECLTSTKDTTSITSPKDIDTKPTDHLEFRNALSRFLHLNPSIDEQVSPVCRPNFMIMYSSPQGGRMEG